MYFLACNALVKNVIHIEKRIYIKYIWEQSFQKILKCKRNILIMNKINSLEEHNNYAWNLVFPGYLYYKCQNSRDRIHDCWSIETLAPFLLKKYPDRTIVDSNVHRCEMITDVTDLVCEHIK
jgi:hypothetical protein